MTCNVRPCFVIPSIHGYKRIPNPVPLKCGKFATKYRQIYGYFYRPRSRGDNTFGSVRVWRVCVCVSVRLSVGALLFDPVTVDLDFWHEGRS